MDEFPKRDESAGDSSSGLPQPVTSAARVVAAAFGVCFGGAGVAVLSFLWSSPFGEFHSPPLFFRVFGSCIAIPFVVIGGSMLWAGITGTPFTMLNAARRRGGEHDQQPGTIASGYVCPSCAAPLADGADVSPSGDVKCPHCRTWFNIHHA